MSWFIQQALAGNCFIGTNVWNGSAVLPVSNGTAQTFGIWNPAGSGINMILGNLSMGAINATTPAVSGVSLGYVPNAGSAIGAAGAPITAFTATAPVNSQIGFGGKAARGRFTVSATTIAMTPFYSVGFSRESTTAGNGLWSAKHSFDGLVIVPPNTFVGVGATTVQTQSYFMTLSWAEVDI